MASDCLHVLTTLLGIYTVCEGYMAFVVCIVVIKERPCEDGGDGPTLTTLLEGDGGLVLHKEMRKLLEGVCWDNLSLPRDLDILATECGKFNRPRLENIHHILHRQADKACQVGLEGDADKPLRGLVLCNGRLRTRRHVVQPCLLILETSLRVTRLYDELVTEDIRELGSIAVLASDNLLLILIVIAAGEKVAKDKLRSVDLILRVLLDGNTVTVVLYDNLEVAVDFRRGDFNMLYGSFILLGLRTDKCVTSIDYNLIKELVETRIESHLPVDHLSLLCVIDPSEFRMSFHRTNVGIWELKDVIPMGQTLILIGGGCHCFSCWARGGPCESILARLCLFIYFLWL